MLWLRNTEIAAVESYRKLSLIQICVPAIGMYEWEWEESFWSRNEMATKASY